MNNYLKSLLLGEGSQTLISRGDFFTNQMLANAKHGNWQAFWAEVETRRGSDLSSYYFNEAVVKDLIEILVSDDSYLEKIVNRNYDKFFNNFLTDLKIADFETEFFLRPLFSLKTDQLLKDFNNYFAFKLKSLLKTATEEELNQQFFDFENQLRKLTNQKIQKQAKNKYLDILVKSSSLQGIVFKGIGLNGPDFLFEKIAYRENEQLTLFDNNQDKLRAKFQEILSSKLTHRAELPGGLDSLAFIQGYQETLFKITSDYFHLSAKKSLDQDQIIDLLNNLNSDATYLKHDLINLIKTSSKTIYLEQIITNLAKNIADPSLESSDADAFKIAIDQLT